MEMNFEGMNNEINEINIKVDISSQGRSGWKKY